MQRSRKDRIGPSGLRGVGALVLCLVSLAVGAAAARATLTDPFLAISRGVSQTGAAGIYVRVDGSFPAADMVQLDYPLQVLVRQVAGGSEFIRFDLAAGAIRGSLAALADGLDPADVATLMATGVEEPGARVLGLGPDRIELLLPADFPAGGAEVQLFVIDEGDVILSNSFAITIVGGAP